MTEESNATPPQTRGSRTLTALLVFIILVILFYAVEDLRGIHAWNSFKREWEARGERFDRASVTPPAVPDAENFALTPLVFTCYGQLLTRDGKAIPFLQRDTNFVDRLRMDLALNYDWPTNTTGSWAKGTRSHLENWQAYYRNLAATTNLFAVPPQPVSPAADVLLALGKYDATIEELRRDAQRPHARFPLEYDKENPAAILLPHLAAMKRVTQVLQLRTLAELEAGQNDKALADVKLGLRLADSIRAEPFLISHLVRIAQAQILLQPIYDGLAAHRWTDAQLVELDAELARLDFLADYHTAMRGEMNMFQVGCMEFLRHHPEEFAHISVTGPDDQDAPGSSLMRLVPNGWFYQNQVRCVRMTKEFFLPLADVTNRVMSPAAVRLADATLEKQISRPTPYNIIERMLMPALGAAAKKFAYAQAATDLARTAVALERCRLATGNFPDTLDALTPKFIAELPHDVVNGQPLKYRREADGNFILYSVGWNETDDGGEVVFTKGQTPSVDNSKGDWTWRYPKGE